MPRPSFRQILAGLLASSAVLIASRIANSHARATLLDSGACGESPNCCSTRDPRPSHASDPLPFTGTESEAAERVRRVVLGLPRTRLSLDEGSHLRFEVRSLVFGFVDDLDVWIDGKASVIHLRSASRVGYSDLGVNAGRLKEIRRRYLAGGSR